MNGLAGTQLLLCGWYAYMAVLAVLAALSAGPRGAHGLLAGAAAAACLGLLLLLFRGPSLPGVGEHLTQVSFALNLVPVAVGLALAASARRQDTRLIGVLLAGASALPLLLYFWSPGQ